MSDWPKHPDGRPMTMGEMTPEQRRVQMVAAAQRYRMADNLDNAGVKEQIDRALRAGGPSHLKGD